ncbi:MAG TPA: hypothetical protein VLQ65_03840 [Saliniramus sp.]|jgi:hypothetical protein|nr:hypothetical protein [Saliniramus sp.]
MSKGQKRSSKETRKPAAEKEAKSSGPKYLQQGDTIQANRLGAQRPQK